MPRRRRPPRVKLLHKPGAPPGTLIPKKDAPPPNIEIIAFNRDEFKETSVDDVTELSRLIQHDWVTWVNIHGLGDTQTIEQLGEHFGLHPLALEDVFNLQQRPKVEDYDNHLFVVLRMASLSGQLKFEQVSLFVGEQFVVTIQEREGDCFDPVRNRLRKSRVRLRSSGADYLAYALIDAIVDAYFPIVDDFGEKMEQIDSQLSDGRHANFMELLHQMRGDLMALRRAIRPLRDELMQLSSDGHSIIKDETLVYLRDCYDHSIQLIDLLDTYREFCADLRDYYMSIVSNRMNEVMKVLTIIGTIFIPLGFIAGLYGMNFNPDLPRNMPELNVPYGYLIAIGFMALIGVGLVGYIWQKGWLGSDTTPINIDRTTDQ